MRLQNRTLVVIPGGPGQIALMDDEAVLGWVRKVHETSRWTTSVCTGALVLAAAGLLNDTPRQLTGSLSICLVNSAPDQ
jgi:putative intracellular protease/amidase